MWTNVLLTKEEVSMRKAKVFKLMSCALVLVLTCAGIQMNANADFIGTRQLASVATTEIQRDELRTLFAREDVARQLSSMGVDVVDAQERVASLSDSEVEQLYQQIQDLPAGAGALGTIAIVLLILILLDVAGVTDIFPKI